MTKYFIKKDKVDFMNSKSVLFCEITRHKGTEFDFEDFMALANNCGFDDSELDTRYLKDISEVSVIINDLAALTFYYDGKSDKIIITAAGNIEKIEEFNKQLISLSNLASSEKMNYILRQD